MNEELKALLLKPAAPLQEVGRVCFGLSKHGVYNAVKSGSIPTIKIGGAYFVTATALRKLLGIEAAA